MSGHDDLDAYEDAEGKNKPKPYTYIEAAKRLDISPSLCCVFEDTAAGIEAAAGAGMYTIAVPNRFTKDQDFSLKPMRFIGWITSQTQKWLIKVSEFMQIRLID